MSFSVFPAAAEEAPRLGKAETCGLEVTWAGLGQACQLPPLTRSNCDSHRGTSHSFGRITNTGERGPGLWAPDPAK